jgi:methyltransferase family protein
MSIRASIPWQFKIAAKIVLSRLPVSYRTWSKLRLFRHGCMDESQYAYDIFDKHFAHARALADRSRPFTLLELGPGDSLSSALLGKAFGCSKVYLVDAGRFAASDLAPYRQMAARLAEMGRPIAGMDACHTVADVLALCSAEYLSAGVESLATIAADSVDFIFSNAVLEHIRLRDFVPLCRELRRIQRRDGLGSHTIDFKDHLQESLNNLRFSEKFWEAEAIASSGFYTNRIRPPQMLAMLRDAGFTVEVLAERRWPKVPVARRKLARPYRELPEDELRVSGLDVLVR